MNANKIKSIITEQCSNLQSKGIIPAYAVISDEQHREILIQAHLTNQPYLDQNYCIFQVNQWHLQIIIDYHATEILVLGRVGLK